MSAHRVVLPVVFIPAVAVLPMAAEAAVSDNGKWAFFVRKQKEFEIFFAEIIDKLQRLYYNITVAFFGGVAQFGRALGSGPRGHGFKSRHSDQIKKSGKPVFMRFPGLFFVFMSRRIKSVLG